MSTVDKTQIEAQETLIELDPGRTAEHDSAVELNDAQLEDANGGTMIRRTYKCPKCRVTMKLISKETPIFKCPKCQQQYSFNW